MAPTIQSYPQLGFSLAIRTTRCSISASRGGRPMDLRNLDPSNFLAMSFRYQRNKVSGLAADATSAKALRPKRWAISANVTFSESDSSNLPLIWALRILFSAARYSFLNNNSWSTLPVIYANIRAQVIYRPSAFCELGLYALVRFEERIYKWRTETS